MDKFLFAGVVLLLEEIVRIPCAKATVKSRFPELLT